MQTRITELESGSATSQLCGHGEATSPPGFTYLVNGVIQYLAEHLPWALTDMLDGKALCRLWYCARALSMSPIPCASAVHLLCAIMNKVCLGRIWKRTAG